MLNTPVVCFSVMKPNYQGPQCAFIKETLSIEEAVAVWAAHVQSRSVNSFFQFLFVVFFFFYKVLTFNSGA